MKSGQKHYLKIFGLRMLKIKKYSNGNFDTYLLGLPFLSIRTSGKYTNINFLCIQNLKDKFKKISSHRLKAQNHRDRMNICQKFCNGEKIKICLQTSRPGMWNYDNLCKLLEVDGRFEVIPFVMPDLFQGKEAMLNYLNKTMETLQQKGLNPVSGWDSELNAPLDLRKRINPDIILYSDFWKPHIPEDHYITHFRDKITMLYEYGYSVMQENKVVVFELNNLVDIYFRQTQFHKEMAIPLMGNGAKNVKIVGSPKVEPFSDDDYKPQDVWKKQDKPKKRIIWAPHHSRIMPNDMYCCNAFWQIYDFMLDIAEKYKDKVQIAFRPHPMLFAKVKEFWGEYAANDYYKRWEKLENTQLSDGNFVDLFMTSDAMIMDCCSFLAEYTATNKPLFYTRGEGSRINLNEFGEELFKNVYDTKSDLEENIIEFIEDVVINGNDYKKEQRTKFVQEYFGKINGKTASENIYDEIVKFLEKGEV